ncbi:hypothetical protein [Streptomyces narbonensis]|uniref:hypothetical protein n=1 Tax=Streptomyces narbonensis TaxID=67333 RepID=UPI0033EE5786
MAYADFSKTPIISRSRSPRANGTSDLLDLSEFDFHVAYHLVVALGAQAFEGGLVVVEFLVELVSFAVQLALRGGFLAFAGSRLALGFLLLGDAESGVLPDHYASTAPEPPLPR